MGIIGLQKYILASQSIAQHCDFKEEIEKWRLDHNGDNPTILIDLKELANIIPKIFDNSWRLGGLFDKYVTAVTYFLEELKRCRVNLVFFMKVKLYDDVEKNKAGLTAETLGSVAYSDKLQRANNRWIYNMVLITQEYGQLIVTRKRHNMVIINYAVDHPGKVLSIIGNDTDFMVLDGKCQYWSMAPWVQQHSYPKMDALKFDRNALMADTGLSNEQLRLLVAISDTMENWFAFSVPGKRLTNQDLLKRAIEYAGKQCLTDKNTFDWEQISSELDRKNHTAERAAFFQKRYDKFDPDQRNDAVDNMGCVSATTAAVWNFFQNNHVFMFRSSFGLGDHIGWFKDLCCLDKGDSSNIEFTDAIFTALAKSTGILYNDESEEQRPEMKRFYNQWITSDGGDIECREVIYPPEMGATLKQLVMEGDNKAYDDQRWNLLQWVLGATDGFLATVRTIPQAKKIRVAVIALHFILAKSFIDPASAKCILCNELIGKKSRNSYKPRNYCPAPKVSVRRPRIQPNWQQEAHKYTMAYLLVCQAMQICGLPREADLITFNAFDFYIGMANPNRDAQNAEFEDILFATDA